jgi:hypothetical protein
VGVVFARGSREVVEYVLERFTLHLLSQYFSWVLRALAIVLVVAACTHSNGALIILGVLAALAAWLLRWFAQSEDAWCKISLYRSVVLMRPARDEDEQRSKRVG